VVAPSITGSLFGTASVARSSISASYASNASDNYIICQVLNTNGQSINTATFTAINYPSESWDTSNMHSNVTNNTRITVPINGYYRATATLGFEANSTGSRILTFRVNGDVTDRYGYFSVPALSGSLSNYITTTAVFNLNANDYIEVYAYQNSGVTLDTQGEPWSGQNRFTVERL
jgi:hypothetical protein